MHGEAEVLVGEACCHASAGRAVEKSDLNQERLVDFFESVFFFGQGGSQCAEAYGTTVVFLNDRKQKAAIDFVEAVGIHFEQGEGCVGGGAVDGAGAADLRVVADAAQEAIGDAWSAAGAQCDFGGAVCVDGDTQDLGGALDDEAEFVLGVELQAQEDAEARTQWRTEESGPGGGAHEGEGTDLHDMGAGCRSLSDDDVEFVVFEGGVELFLKDRLHAMDFVEEEDLLFAQVSQDGGEIALDLERGSRGLLEGDIELVGDDGGEGRFAQAGRAEEQHMIERFAARPGGFERDGQLFLRLGLADELAEPARAQLQLEILFVFGARGTNEAFRGIFLGTSHAEGSVAVGCRGRKSRGWNSRVCTWDGLSRAVRVYRG